MRIVDVRTHVLEAPLTEPFRWSFSEATRRETCLVEVVGEGGLSGWGECLGPARVYAAIVEGMKPLMVGQSALATDLLWQTLYDRWRDLGQKGLTVAAISGVDNALWDLKGKHFGVPVHVLMGGPLRTEVKCYATGTYRLRRGDPLRYVVEEVKRYQKQGIGATKIKIGFGVDADAELIRAVREAVGPDYALMLDANHAYDAADAIRLGRLAADCDLGWFEEPVPPENLDAYLEVKQGQPIPVAGGECEYTRHGFRNVLMKRCVDVLQPDTCMAGGLSECKKIADMAHAFGVRYVPHCWGTAVGLATALQLLAVLPHTPPSWNAREPILEFDRSEHPFRQAVVKSPVEHVDGVVQIPTGPGLGVEIDRDGIERFKVR
jgi:D-galactarolactone cycloisomerase